MNLVPLLKLQVTSETQRKDASREDGGWEPGRMTLESLLLSSVSWRKSFHLSRPQFPQLEGDSHDLYMAVVVRVKWGVLKDPAEGLACRSSIYFMEWQVTRQDLAGGKQECVYPGTACHCWMHQAGVTSVHWASYTPHFLPWALLQGTLLPAWSNASRRLAKCPTVAHQFENPEGRSWLLWGENSQARLGRAAIQPRTAVPLPSSSCHHDWDHVGKGSRAGMGWKYVKPEVTHFLKCYIHTQTLLFLLLFNAWQIVRTQ